ncbi:SGNH/GDSL hydrolase family protein [Candidatus Parabeggiatoa sp. HSG14]|uniref:SGNH/GDSL hydrolase family protein n=1 Tax=Candidatus Parabeggiatoa sp. HSG14 TaxID=3055593 RepID=UPI0025A83295|nr:SGNH/GDSL hydrolase family protein [Thiotrichales bacterium HSG14]
MKIAKNITYLIIIFVIFLVILELLFRTIAFFIKGSEIEYSEIVSDSTFGWVHNTQMKKRVTINKCDEKVIRLPSKNPLINKLPKYSADKNILFIGDSFTHAHEVSTGQAYFDVFEENVKNQYSVYAAGIGGFGNLQEYLILEFIFEGVKPDIVMWQLCSNDVNNNVYELDNSSFYNNQRPRPYLNVKNSQIKIKNPGFWLFDWSHGTRFVFHRLLLLDWKYKLGLLELLNSTIALDSKAQEKYEKQGLEVLEKVLNKAMTDFPNTKFYGFSVDGEYDKDYENIFIKNGAMYFSEFYDYVDSTEGTNCHPLDTHWNHLGNKVAGDTLSKLLLELER